MRDQANRPTTAADESFSPPPAQPPRDVPVNRFTPVRADDAQAGDAQADDEPLQGLTQVRDALREQNGQLLRLNQRLAALESRLTENDLRRGLDGAMFDAPSFLSDDADATAIQSPDSLHHQLPGYLSP